MFKDFEIRTAGLAVLGYLGLFKRLVCRAMHNVVARRSRGEVVPIRVPVGCECQDLTRASTLGLPYRTLVDFLVLFLFRLNRLLFFAGLSISCFSACSSSLASALRLQ